MEKLKVVTSSSASNWARRLPSLDLFKKRAAAASTNSANRYAVISRILSFIRELAFKKNI